MDYWWVSLGVLGIIGATFTYKKEYSTAITPWHKGSLVAVYNQYLDFLNSQQKYYSDSSGFRYDLFEDKTEAEEFKASNKVFKHIFEQANKYKDTILIHEDYRFVDTIIIPLNNFLDTAKNKFVIETSKGCSFMANRLRGESNTLIALRNRSTRDNLNWILLIISPYLLAIAIAIRLTKVTAELKGI